MFVFHVRSAAEELSSVACCSPYTTVMPVLLAGIVAAMSAASDHMEVGLIIKSETTLSLAAFLAAFVSVLALLNPIFFHNRSTFCVSEIAIYAMLILVIESPEFNPILINT